jgi:hypothetical protein
MIDMSWRRERNDRSLRYAGRILPPGRAITIKLDRAFGARYDGQVTAVVMANLLARMTPSLVLDLPEIEVVPALPWAGARLGALLREAAFAADPEGRFELREARDGDYVLSLGRDGGKATVHGSGWNAFIGPGPSPVPDSTELNPLGPALAAVVAVGRLFGLKMGAMDGPHVLNAFDWQNLLLADSYAPLIGSDPDLGTIWAVGLGSVGTAALYFLTLMTRRFSLTLFDMDSVKIHNLDRSPIFKASDAKDNRKKVDATEGYLRSVGVEDVRSVPFALDESSLWSNRQAGTPDIVISAANERNVRYFIEQSAPPLQIYGTTGANWEASVIRHTPMVDACSCCLFPPGEPQAVATCATEKTVHQVKGETVDASLPFLSFGAGLMAASEMLKARLPGYPFSPNRTLLYMHPDSPPRLISRRIQMRAGCVCAERSLSVHGQMIGGTKYEGLSFINRGL